MNGELFFVLRAIKRDDLAMLAGYADVVEQARAQDLIWGLGGQVRLTGDGQVQLFDEECRRQEAGLDLDLDPRADP